MKHVRRHRHARPWHPPHKTIFFGWLLVFVLSTIILADTANKHVLPAIVEQVAE